MANPGNQATQIFISYRRGDSADVTGRIYDRLVQRFGKEAIFKDVDSIPLGVNFRKHIDSMVEQCAVLLVVIGERWNTGVDETGKCRLDDARDFVRIEIESALQRDIPVIPVFVQDALMPAEESLPPSVQELTYRNGITIGHDPHFHIDVDRLIKQLESYFKRSVTEHKLEQTGESGPGASSISSQAASEPSSVQLRPSQEPLRIERETAITSVEKREQVEKKPRLLAAIGFHLLLGFGMFYVDKSVRRKWVYPLFPIYALLDWCLASLGVQPFKSGGGLTFLISAGLYLLSFIDVIRVCRSKARRTARGANKR